MGRIATGQSTPTYLGIVLGTIVLYVLGGLYVVGGAALMTSALMGTRSAASSGATSDAVVTGMLTPLFAVGAAVVCAGFLFFLAGSVAMAIRDIARNSFGR